MHKVLDFLVFLSLLVLAAFGGFKASQYYSDKSGYVADAGNGLYDPLGTQWNYDLVGGKWLAETEIYKILMILEESKYFLLLVNKDDKSLRMFSKGDYLIDNQTVVFKPDLNIKRPDDADSNNSYIVLAKSEFHADIAFHRDIMLWSVDNVYLAPYMIGEVKYPSHPFFRYVDSQNIRWQRK